MGMGLVAGVLLGGYQSFSHAFFNHLSSNNDFHQVSEDPKESGKREFVNFKRDVWHRSFQLVIESIVEYSKTGCWLKCGDGQQRWIFPTILILSADYEEQYVSPFHDLMSSMADLYLPYQVHHGPHPWNKFQATMSHLFGRQRRAR
jgi:hypothetical protein